MDGAVIAYPGLSPAHGYPASSNYTLLSLAQALTNVTPDLFLIDMGVNDMGRGRNPYFVATNDMAALLDMIFAKNPAANIIVGKPTSITHASILSLSQLWHQHADLLRRPPIPGQRAARAGAECVCGGPFFRGQQPQHDEE